MKRVAIFVFYHNQGELTADVEYLIRQLKSVVDNMIIVVNGQIIERNKIKKLADYLIIRENQGYDAGAYKEALLNEAVCTMINESDELVFCNDTFYGPFISFSEIFSKMKDSPADFWGLNFSDDGLKTFMQSYFLVFKKNIWSSGDLERFFTQNIDEETLDFKYVLMSFERGIFEFLVKHGYTYDAVNKQNYHIFLAVDGSICYDKLPVLKKKAFLNKYYEKEKMLNALCYIDRYYDYNIQMILDDIKDRYNIELDYTEIENHEIKINNPQRFRARVTRDDIISFAEKNDNLFIYGAGQWGKVVKNILKGNNIKGFIVSDNSQQEEMLGYKVYKITDFKEYTDISIIVALSEKNRKEVEPLLVSFPNKLFIL